MLPAAVEKMLSRILGKKQKTSANIAAGIAAQEDAVAACHERIAAAQAARNVAIEEFDAVGHREADEAAAEAHREIERLERAIEVLNVAHAEAVDVESRDVFRQKDAALVERSAALTLRLQKDYGPAGKIIANLIADLRQFKDDHRALVAEGQTLGEPITSADPENCRGTSPKQWSAVWRAPDGTHTISGPIEEAPRGSIRWVEGEPVATRDGVEVRCRGGGTAPASLVLTVGDLPGLNVADKPFHTSVGEAEFFGVARRV